MRQQVAVMHQKIDLLLNQASLSAQRNTSSQSLLLTQSEPLAVLNTGPSSSPQLTSLTQPLPSRRAVRHAKRAQQLIEASLNQHPPPSGGISYTYVTGNATTINRDDSLRVSGTGNNINISYVRWQFFSWISTDETQTERIDIDTIGCLWDTYIVILLSYQIASHLAHLTLHDKNMIINVSIHKVPTHADTFRAFRTWSRLCFFASITLKRSKSFRSLRFSLVARFCAHADLSHFSTTASCSTSFRTTPDPAPRGSFVSLMGVRRICL